MRAIFVDRQKRGPSVEVRQVTRFQALPDGDMADESSILPSAWPLRIDLNPIRKATSRKLRSQEQVIGQ